VVHWALIKTRKGACLTPRFDEYSVKIWMQDTGCTMQDRNGSDSGYLVPGTRYLAPLLHSHISNLNKALCLGDKFHMDSVGVHPYRSSDADRIANAGLGTEIRSDVPATAQLYGASQAAWVLSDQGP